LIISYLFGKYIKSIIPTGLVLKTVFSFLVVILTLGGCTRQKVFRPTATETHVPQIRVALDDNFTHGTLLFRDTYVLRSEEAEYILDPSVGEFDVTFAGGELSFRSEYRHFSFSDFTQIIFRPRDSGKFSWNGVAYEGILSFDKQKNRVIVVNTLPVPPYLQGVIPYEIPSGLEDYYQAVLSQTVAARTYAIYCIQHPVSDYFDLYADTRDQVYLGNKSDSPLVDRAIQETFGMVLQKPDNTISKVQYHSTCGGLLDPGSGKENNENFQVLNRQDNNGSSFNCTASPLYRWVFKLNTRDILDNLTDLKLLSPAKAAKLKENGFRLSLEILSRTSAGRVHKMAIQINSDKFILSEWQIQRALSDRNSQRQPSNLFILKASRNIPDIVYVIGAGYGHGRGMCQWGAIGQSLNGVPYRDILKFYYPDLILKKIY
jgi:stage II sporulation protein D